MGKLADQSELFLIWEPKLQPILAKLTLLVLLAQAWSPVWPASPPVIVAADQWCPFFCRAGDPLEGYSIELIRESMKLMGLEVNYINAAFARITSQVERGEWQIHGATSSAFTPTLLIGREAVAHSRWVFVVKRGRTFRYAGPESLKNMIFAGIRGYVYSAALTEYYRRPENRGRLIEVAGDAPQKQILLMLQTGRVDFIVEDENVVRYWSRLLNLEKELEFAGVDSETNFYPGYRLNDKQALQLADKMDKALQTVKRNRAFMDALTKKYDLISWN